MRKTLIALVAGLAIGYAVQCEDSMGPALTAAMAPDGARIIHIDGAHCLDSMGRAWYLGRGEGEVWDRQPELDALVPSDSLVVWSRSLMVATDGRSWRLSNGAWVWGGIWPGGE